jgi:hypothetical protein
VVWRRVVSKSNQHWEQKWNQCKDWKQK